MSPHDTRHTAKTILWTVLGTLGGLLLVLLVLPYTGAVNVAATHSHLPGVHWFLETTQRNSVTAMAGEVEPPADLASPQRIDRGLRAYHQMCAGCHGAPGVEPDWMGQGLNPEPPALWEDREIGSGQAAEDYVIIEHGIRMTGMPALEPSHSEEEVWDLVAFVQHLPEMTPRAYASAIRDAGLDLQAGHEHGGGGHGASGESGSATEPDSGHEDHTHGESPEA